MTKDLTTGSIGRTVFSLAWPTAVGMALHTAFNIVDFVYVGRLGPGAMAAVTQVLPVVFLMIGLASMIGIGGTSLIARRLGARQQDRADSAATHSFVLAACMGVTFSCVALAFQRPLFRLIGADAETLPLALDYSKWIFAAAAFTYLTQAASGVLRAQGDMKTPMRVMVLAVLTNMVLDPLLIFGFGFWPRLGVEGAAIATFVSRLLGCVLMLMHVLGGRSAVRITFRGFRPEFSTLADIIWVGLPASANHVVMSVSHMFFVRLLSDFGHAATAAFGVVNRLNAIVILPCLGIATAVLAIVGQNVGARDYDRAEAAAWTAAAYAMIVMEAVGIVFFVAPWPWVRMFTDDPAVIDCGMSALRIVSLTYMFIGMSIVLSQAFQGAGKGLPALVLTLLRLVVVALPAAWVLVRLIGLNGVWFAIAGSSVIASLASAAWFRSGTWKRPTRIAAGELTTDP